MPSGVGFGAGAGLTVVWSYALWFGGNAVLPRWNARWPNWAVAPAIWPLLGLIGVLSGVIFGVMVGAWSPAGALTMLAPYLFLSLRNTCLLYTSAPPSSSPISSLPPPQLGSGRQQALVDLENLLLLRLELQRQLEAGVLTAERHRQLIDELDEAWSQHCLLYTSRCV